jgi:hypothetical protein
VIEDLKILKNDAEQKKITLHASHLGYQTDSRKWAIVRVPSGSSQFSVCMRKSTSCNFMVKCKLEEWGEAWGAHWHVVDFTQIEDPGMYDLELIDSDGEILTAAPIKILSNSLFEELYEKVALLQLEQRATKEKLHNKLGGGLADCGGPLREFSSHAVTAFALEETLESELLNDNSEYLNRTRALLENILEYLLYCGTVDGSFRHEGYPPCHNDYGPTDRVVAHDSMLGVVCFARASQLFTGIKKERYLTAALQAWKWCMAKEPIGYYRSEWDFQGDWSRRAKYNLMARVLGQEDDFKPPYEFRARDIMMLCWGAYCLWTATKEEKYSEVGFRQIQKLMKLQTTQENAVDGLFGDFLMWPSCEIHQSNFEHAGFGYHVGAILPDCFAGVLGFIENFSSHPKAGSWKEMLSKYVYGYLIPAAKRNPFGLIPHGIGPDGLNFFKYIWHGCNCMYLFAGSQAIQLGDLLGEKDLHELAQAQAQWILGINPGILNEETNTHKPINMLIGLNERSMGGWIHNDSDKIAWSISNGFSAHRQFNIDFSDMDGPHYFCDEDWIPHGAGLISLMVKLAKSV